MNLVARRIAFFALDAGKLKAKYFAHVQPLVRHLGARVLCTCSALVFILFPYPCFPFALIASSLSDVLYPCTRVGQLRSQMTLDPNTEEGDSSLT